MKSISRRHTARRGAPASLRGKHPGAGKAGATNAGILAAQILALSDPELAKKMGAHKEKLARSVEDKSNKLKSPGR